MKLNALALALFGGLFLVSCGTFEDDPKVFYKRDIIMEIDGKEHIGFAVLSPRKKLTLKLRFKDKGDMLYIKTCHRNIEIEKAWKSRGFFGSLTGKKRAKVSINLSPIELEEMCPVEIIALSRSGKHSWALIDWDNIKKPNKATYYCDGQVVKRNGVGICQAFHGLEQKIQFTKPTNIRTDCPYERVNDKTFTFRPMAKECLYYFFAEDESEHRMTTMGYESVKIGL